VPTRDHRSITRRGAPSGYRRSVTRSGSDPGGGRPAQLDVGRRRRLIARSVARIVVVVALLLTAYYAAPWTGGASGDVAIRTAVALVILVVAVVVSLGVVVGAEYPLLSAVEALTVVVVLATVSFASIYVVMSSRSAASFSESLGRTDALYFALTTATTIGYGDIHAKTEGARILVMVQMVTNVVVVGVAARLLLNVARREADSR
jgi:voltage-gated potassium channel